MRPNLYNLIPALEGEELVFIQNLTAGLSDERLHNFIAVYNGKRRKTDQIIKVNGEWSMVNVFFMIHH